MFSINHPPVWLSLPSAWDIYIPLCFLLIGNRCKRQSGKDWHLHSTMFSINLDCFSHFLISFLLIYIPLCFLLIGKARQDGITMGMNLHSTMFSINPHRPEESQQLQSNLHSTMFSINLVFCLYWICIKKIYIPLCFLLISVLISDIVWDLNLHSTMFSINRLLSQNICRHIQNLHSTMFSINQGTGHERLCAFFIFTFHYVFY